MSGFSPAFAGAEPESAEPAATEPSGPPRVRDPRFLKVPVGATACQVGAYCCSRAPRCSSGDASIPSDSARLRGMSPSDRSTVLTRLASVLLEAAGVADGERGDDEH
jgi:hypothetical protein